MKESPRSYRFSIDVKELIMERAKKEHIDLTEAVERMIRENDRLHLYIRYLGTFQQATKEAPQCLRRLLIEGEFYCVQTNKKGLQKLKKLPLLEICRICHTLIAEGYGIPERAKKPLTVTIKEPRIKHPDMKYCINGGLWVYPSKCKTCKTPC